MPGGLGERRESRGVCGPPWLMRVAAKPQSPLVSLVDLVDKPEQLTKPHIVVDNLCTDDFSRETIRVF